VDSNYDELNKLAKKYKKLFEKMTINFGAYKINQNDYYLVVYKRKKINGLAIISPQSITNKNECLEALKWLTRYNQFRNIGLVHIGFRADINFDSFYTVQNFLEKVLQNVSLSTNEKKIFEESNRALQTIINLQHQLIPAYKSFLEKEQKVELGEIKVITKNHINDMLNFINTADYIQYTQLTTQYNNISVFKEINEMAKNNANIQPFVDSAVKTYLGEFVISKANLRKNIKAVTHVPDLEQLSKEEHIEVARKTTLQNIDEIAERNKSKLRHPKI
jgi:acyl carrier protein phosphodiesterase